MSEATQWTELLLKKQQMDANAQARQDAAWKDSAERVGQAGGQLAAGLTDQHLLKAMDEWKTQRIADNLRREMAAAGRKQGNYPATSQPMPQASQYGKTSGLGIDLTSPNTDVAVPVLSQSDFDALPSGTIYYRADGSRYRKP